MNDNVYKLLNRFMDWIKRLYLVTGFMIGIVAVHETDSFAPDSLDAFLTVTISTFAWLPMTIADKIIH